MGSHNGPPYPQNYITFDTFTQNQKYGSKNSGVHRYPNSTSNTLTSRTFNNHYSESPSSKENFLNLHHRVSLKTQHKFMKYSNVLPPVPDPLASGGAPRVPPGLGDSDTNLYIRNGPKSPFVFKNPGSSNYTQGYISNDPASNLYQNSLPSVLDSLTPGGAIRAPPGFGDSGIEPYHCDRLINPFGYKYQGYPGHPYPPLAHRITQKGPVENYINQVHPFSSTSMGSKNGPPNPLNYNISDTFTQNQNYGSKNPGVHMYPNPTSNTLTSWGPNNHFKKKP